MIEASLICAGEKVAEETGRFVGKGPEKRFGLAQAFGKEAKEATTKKKKEKK